jgi:hypothetical protein
MVSQRDEFLESVKKIMQERTGNKCSNTECRHPTSGPNADPNKATRIGVAAHITAAAENGPRYDHGLTKDERRSILNGIWLCQNCSKLVDSDEYNYSVNLLQRWKAYAEELARLEMEKGELSPEDQYTGYYCPHCDTFCKDVVTVCTGCNSDIYYGSTPVAWKQDNQMGRTTGGFGVLLFFMLVPDLLNGWFGISIPMIWGANFLIVLVLAAFSGLGLGAWIAKSNNDMKKKNPPTFVRKSH